MSDYERARMRAEEDREIYAIRREEHVLELEETQLEKKLRKLEVATRRREHAIEREWRHEQWGHPPERRPAWL